MAKQWRAGRTPKWTHEDRQLLEHVRRAKDGCAKAFRTDFDTPAAVQLLVDLVSRSNRHISQGHGVSSGVIAATSFVGETFGLLGVQFAGWDALQMMLGWGQPPQSVQQQSGNEASRLNPALDEFVDFRMKVRNLALANIKGAPSDDLPKQLLGECDFLRDQLGGDAIRIGLRDQSDSSTWSLKP